ncbi:suppression of tumorigenicity 5 st5 [Anaeramoeba ignava]|uniref:Suppression of tumorigenicity 5 st5 n=1 Tax=Anaeramoeba ignava TaxID=1746090 RepID=A0A9Q0LMR3_ANAIG|nr:suppression of tumorigenicity 5 st5 [Anaeramoeba ignava]
MENNKEKLFTHFFLVKLLKKNIGIKNKSAVVVPFCLPKLVTSQIRKNIRSFCFPVMNQFLNIQEDKVETFSFLFTKEDGSRLYASCRRILRKNKDPDCLVLLSKQPIFRLLDSILEKSEELNNNSITKLINFISELDKLEMPEMGTTFEISVKKSQTNEYEKFTFSRHENEYGDQYTELLFQTLELEVITSIFSSLLLERKFIFYSKETYLFSNIVLNFISLLEPFTWINVCIPVLPEKLTDTASAPMPFILGVHADLMQTIQELPLDDVIMIDLDSKTIQYTNRDLDLLPEKFINKFIAKLSRHINLFREKQQFDNQIIHFEFLDFFIEIFANYPSFMIYSEKDNQYIFDSQSFTSSQPKILRKFLLDFQKTQLFEFWQRNQEKNYPNLEFDNFHQRINNLLENKKTNSKIMKQISKGQRSRSNTHTPNSPREIPKISMIMNENLNENLKENLNEKNLNQKISRKNSIEKKEKNLIEKKERQKPHLLSQRYSFDSKDSIDIPKKISKKKHRNVIRKKIISNQNFEKEKQNEETNSFRKTNTSQFTLIFKTNKN